MPQGPALLGVIHFWDTLWGVWGVLFSACRKREMMHADTKWKLISQNRFHVTQMVQVESPKVPRSIAISTFEALYEVSFSLHSGKGKSCMWTVNKVEICFTQIHFIYSKCSNWNALGFHTPWCHPLLRSIVRCLFLCMQEKGNPACGMLIWWKFIFLKWV